MGNLKKQKGDLTKQRILEEAAKLFLEKGYYATSVRDIIERAKVSKGAFYHHFESKLDLYRIVVKEFLDIDDNLIDFSELAKLPINEAFKYFVETYLTYLKYMIKETGMSILQFQRLYFEAMIILPEAYRKVKKTYEKYKTFFHNKIIQENNITPEEAEKLVKKYIFLYEGIFYWVSVFPNTSIDEIIKVIYPNP